MPVTSALRGSATRCWPLSPNNWRASSARSSPPQAGPAGQLTAAGKIGVHDKSCACCSSPSRPLIILDCSLLHAPLRMHEQMLAHVYG